MKRPFLRLLMVFAMAVPDLGCGSGTATAPSTQADTSPSNNDTPPNPTAAPETSAEPPMVVTPASDVALSEPANAPPQETPTLGTVNERVRTTVSKLAKNAVVRLKLFDLASALLSYESAEGHLPAADGSGAPGSPSGFSWRVHLLPYLEDVPDALELYDSFHLDEPWDSPHNKTLIARMPTIFGDDREGRTRFHVVTGPDALFQEDQGTTTDMVIGQEMAETLLIVEGGTDTAEIWTKPGGLKFDPDQPRAFLGNVGKTFHAVMLNQHACEILTDLESLDQLVQVNGLTAPETIWKNIYPSDGFPEASTVPPTPLPPAKESIDVRMIPEDSMAVLNIQPRRVLEHPSTQALLNRINLSKEKAYELFYLSLPFEVQSWLTILGTPIEQIDEIRIVVSREILTYQSTENPDGDISRPPIGVVIQSALPFEIEQIIESEYQLDIQTQIHEIASISCISGGIDLICAFPSETEFVVAPRSMIEAMLMRSQADQLPSGVGKLLQSAGDPVFAAVLDIPEDLSAPLASYMTSMERLTYLILPYVMQTRSVVASINMEGNDVLKLSITFRNENIARELDDTLTPQLADFHKFVGPPPPNADSASINQMMQSLTDFLAKATTELDAATFTYRIPFSTDLSLTATSFFLAWKQAHAESTRKNDLKQIGLSMHIYYDEFGCFPAVDGSGLAENPKSGFSWRVHLLPCLDEVDLYKQFHFDEPWDSPHNKSLIPRMPPVFGDHPEGKTRIHLFTEGGALFRSKEGMKLESVTDDYYLTIMAIHAGPETEEFWTKPGGLAFDPKAPLACLGTIDSDEQGFYAVMMDGSVRFIFSGIDADLFRRLVQFEDGEPTNDF